MANEALKKLHTALFDAAAGYETAIGQAEPTIQSLLRNAKETHERAHRDVHQALTAKGETADESGSFMATVHKAAVTVRAAITGLDRGSLASFADGEQRNLETYDTAIVDENDNAVRAMLHHHQQNLQIVRDRMAGVSDD